MNEKTRKWMAGLAATPEYYAEGIALDLILQCEKRRDELGLSYAEVARRMGVSRQRVATLMSGTQNATIGSLVRLALVLECQLEIGITKTPRKSVTKRGANKAASAEQKATVPVKPKRKTPKPAPTEIHV